MIVCMNKVYPLVSVIMPCFNAEVFLFESVASVFEQSYGNVELIVVDDGSSDSSVSILKELQSRYGNKIRFYTQSNSGPFYARNLALAHANGEYVAFLDADDYWDSEFLIKLYQAIDSKEVDLAYCGWQNVGSHAPGSEPYVPPEYESGDMLREFLRSCPWPIHAALVKRSLIVSMGGFSVERFSAMDYDLWLRLLAFTNKIARVPEVLAFYRWHGVAQISAVKWRQVLDAWHVRKKFIAKYPNLVADINKKELKRIVDTPIRVAAFRAYWNRDIASARILFRVALRRGMWSLGELKYMLPSYLPEFIHRFIVDSMDKVKT